MESKDNKDEIDDEKTIEVPTGNTREDIKSREQIISDVYREWYKANPTKAVYNILQRKSLT